MSKKPIDYKAKKQALTAKKEKLEWQIQNITDQHALALLRADYRKVMDELELFYDDEPREAQQ